MSKRPSQPISFKPILREEIQSWLLEELSSVLPDHIYVLILQFVNEANHWFLRIDLDSLVAERPVSLETCQHVSHLMSPLLEDMEARWPQLPDYTLEVSSPGLFRRLRTLREIEFYQGRQVLLDFPKKLDEVLTQFMASMTRSSGGETPKMKAKPSAHPGKQQSYLKLLAFEHVQQLICFEPVEGGSPLTLPIHYLDKLSISLEPTGNLKPGYMDVVQETHIPTHDLENTVPEMEELAP